MRWMLSVRCIRSGTRKDKLNICIAVYIKQLYEEINTAW
jgi:hypothetical protein